MKERPILFSAPMVRAILSGAKTQTRRAIKDSPVLDVGVNVQPTYVTRKDVREKGRVIGHREVTVPCPYGVPGDRLWVKETIHRGPSNDGYDSAFYVADSAYTALDTWPWQRNVLVSIHCPRGLSRITLEVTGVRVERLQDISEEDAKAEGVEPHGCLADYCEAYEDIWLEINGPGSWAANPWVWVIEFRRVEAKSEAA